MGPEPELSAYGKPDEGRRQGKAWQGNGTREWEKRTLCEEDERKKNEAKPTRAE